MRKTIHLEPIPSDWGDVHLTAIIISEHNRSTLAWEVQYPSSMPQTARNDIEGIVGAFMRSQHDDLLKLFG
jgi:hypothetical protein